MGPATANKLMEMGYSAVESLATPAVNELVTAGITDMMILDMGSRHIRRHFGKQLGFKETIP